MTFLLFFICLFIYLFIYSFIFFLFNGSYVKNRRGGAQPFERGRGRRKIWLKALKKIDMGVGKAVLNSEMRQFCGRSV